MIVGSGSALFEMIRYLAEREPLLVCPAWFFSEAQPIAIRDVLSYLVDALKTPDSTGRVIEIGGPSRLTYADMLLSYAKERGLKRWLIPTPFYAPRLSAYGNAHPLAHRGPADRGSAREAHCPRRRSQKTLSAHQAN